MKILTVKNIQCRDVMKSPICSIFLKKINETLFWSLTFALCLDGEAKDLWHRQQLLEDQGSQQHMSNWIMNSIVPRIALCGTPKHLLT